MRTTLSELRRYRILTTDGRLGLVDDVYFDDERWDLKGLVVDTHSVFPGRKVVLPFQYIEVADRGAKTLRVSRSTSAVKSAPDIKNYKPVSQSTECPGGVGRTRSRASRVLRRLLGTLHPAPRPPKPGERPPRGDLVIRDPHLRSAREVAGYRLQAEDGDAGRVEDFLLETESRKLWFVIVGTRLWLPRGQVVLRPDRIGHISSADHKVYVHAPERDVRRSPKFDPYALAD